MSPTLRGDIFGGLTAAVIALPLAVAFGVLTLAPLGPEYASLGALVGLYGAIFTGFFAAAFGGTPTLITGPTGPMTVVMTSVFADLATNTPHGGDVATELPSILTLAALCVLMGGLFQVLLGTLRVGTLIKFIPYPVIAGFMNGIAVIIFMGQLRPWLGVPVHAPWGEVLSGAASIDVSSVLVGITTILVMTQTARFTKVIPGALVALLVGTGAHYLLQLTPMGAPGAIIGAIPVEVPTPKYTWEFIQAAGDHQLVAQVPRLIAPALALGLLGSIDALLTSVIADSVTKTRHDSNKELRGQGFGNVISALFGGLAGAGATVGTLVNINAGGRTRRSGMIHGVVLLIILEVFEPLAAKIPMAVLAGILVVTAVKMVDDWMGQVAWKIRDHLRENRDLLLNLAVALVVTVVTVVVDLMVAVGIGLAIASVLFIAKMSRSCVTRIDRGDSVRSKIVRTGSCTRVLREHGERIVVFHVEGPIFFGSADHLAETIEQAVKRATHLILDLSRVSEVDSTGAKIIVQIRENLQALHCELAVAGVTNPIISTFMQDLGVVEAIGKDRFFPDDDTALEWAENEILRDVSGSDFMIGETPLEKMEVVQGLTSEELDTLRERLDRRTFDAHEVVFSEGDEHGLAYVLAAGVVSVRFHLGEGERTTRIAAFSPGVVFGEMALLEGKPRSADVIAETDVVAYGLSIRAFKELEREHPAITTKLIVNVSRQLASRLRSTSQELRRLQT